MARKEGLQNPDKFTWQKGDVRTFRNEGEWRAYVERKKAAEAKKAAAKKKK